MANSIRNELRADKVAVTKAKTNSKNEIEISLLSDRTLDKAKKIIDDSKRGLIFKSQAESSGKPKLVYGISLEEELAIKKSAVSQAVETLRSRIDQFGVAEPLIQKVGEDRIMLQMPGVQDIESVKKVVGRVAKLEFRLMPAPGNKDTVQMSGDAVEDARVSFDQNGQMEVALTLNREGGKTFSSVTANNVNRELAIILDGVLYSSPVIRERISGGRCSISGGFSNIQDARELAVVLRAGALPAPLEVLEERTVGPTLGAESIRKGVTAILIGFVLILLFMAIYYGKSGVLASFILGFNIILVLAGLSAMGATLTLPGLAGLALTVGMAVDANVIIFERIREEIRNGAGRDAAVSAGFDKAFSAIIDSNLTTLLAAIILYSFGTGPIRGFAVTLSIGILTTLYCATFIAKLGFDAFSLKGKKNLSI
ncbi:UNVERIFIED_CONTAM: hypothetical protein GTU68_025159 [Idotea baltica]|nr:hypothetical protein [Idotea baltica]